MTFTPLLKTHWSLIRQCTVPKWVNWTSNPDRFVIEGRCVFKNIARIEKLPYMAKKAFIQRKALFKERLYLKKGYI